MTMEIASGILKGMKFVWTVVEEGFKMAGEVQVICNPKDGGCGKQLTGKEAYKAWKNKEVDAKEEVDLGVKEFFQRRLANSLCKRNVKCICGKTKAWRSALAVEASKEKAVKKLEKVVLMSGGNSCVVYDLGQKQLVLLHPELVKEADHLYQINVEYFKEKRVQLQFLIGKKTLHIVFQDDELCAKEIETGVLDDSEHLYLYEGRVGAFKLRNEDGDQVERLSNRGSRVDELFFVAPP